MPTLDSGLLHWSRHRRVIGAVLLAVTLLGCGVAIRDLRAQGIGQHSVAVTNPAVATPAAVAVRPQPAGPLVVDASIEEPGAWRGVLIVFALGALVAGVGFAVLFGIMLPDAKGTRSGYPGRCRDIPTEVAAAKALRLAKERAEAVSRAKSEFLANMSHELRTPLNAIIGFSELIRDQASGGGAAAIVGYAVEVNSAGHHLLDVINDVLDLAKIEAGHYAIADEPVDLGLTARSCSGMLRLRADEGGVRIDNAVPVMHVVLRGDGRALKQVALNLLSNAVKFTPSGGTVSLCTEASRGGVALVVADTGIGIDAGALQSLCQPFQQADASISRRFGGTGLGLAISRRLLALHGATLTIESAPGRGTTVRVMFPTERIIKAMPMGGSSAEPALAA